MAMPAAWPHRGRAMPVLSAGSNQTHRRTYLLDGAAPALNAVVGQPLAVHTVKQRIDGPPLIHRVVSFRDLTQRQREIENFAGFEPPLSTRSIRSGRKRRTGAGRPCAAAQRTTPGHRRSRRGERRHTQWCRPGARN